MPDDASARPRAIMSTLDRESIAAIVLFTLLALLPAAAWAGLAGNYALGFVGRIMIYAIAALSLNLLIGHGALVSLGHAAYLGIGAYAAGILARHGLTDALLALPAAVLASAIFAAATGAVAVRTHGANFIMITLAFGQMAFFVAASLAPYGGDDGLTLSTRSTLLGFEPLQREAVFYYAVLVLLAAAYLLLSRIAVSRFGRVLNGLRQNEERMQSIGFSAYPYRLTAYVIAGAIAGVAGFLLANQAQFVSPAYMSWLRSGELMVIVILGGLGTRLGPILGAFALLLAEEHLAGLILNLQALAVPAAAAILGHPAGEQVRHGIERIAENYEVVLGPLIVLAAIYVRGGLASLVGAGLSQLASPLPVSGAKRGEGQREGPPLEHFPPKWTPVWCRKCDKQRTRALSSDSIHVESALVQVSVAAPHPNPLPAKGGERGRLAICDSPPGRQEAPMTPLLELRDLHKSFGALAVTDGVSLAISPGECHALIGPNGAGKTTLVHQIVGHHLPDRGAILFGGEVITRRSMAERARLGIARSFQITSILPEMSVLENVAVAVQARSGSSFSFARPVANETPLNADAAVVLASVGLGARASELASRLSHGEKRQLELAIAIAMAPRLMLLDEPMAGAGKEDTLRLIETLKALKGRYTMLLVEHDMDAVFALADRVSVLVYGRILATGTAAEIRVNAEVRAAYLGEESPA